MALLRVLHAIPKIEKLAGGSDSPAARGGGVVCNENFVLVVLASPFAIQSAATLPTSVS